MRDATTTRLLGMVRRAIVRLVDDSGAVQRVQVDARAGEAVPDVDHLQPYGLTGNPPVGARTLLLCVGAAFDHVVALVTGHVDRPRGLGPGDVTLYSGHASRLDLRSGGATVKGPGLTVEGDASIRGSATIAGSATVLGTLSAASVTTAGAVSAASLSAGGASLPGFTGTFRTGDVPPRVVTVVGGVITGIA